MSKISDRFNKKAQQGKAKTLYLIAGGPTVGATITKTPGNYLIHSQTICMFDTPLPLTSAILITNDMSEVDAQKLLQWWYHEYPGAKFAAWIPLNDFKELITSSNLTDKSREGAIFAGLIQNMGLGDILKGQVEKFAKTCQPMADLLRSWQQKA